MEKDGLIAPALRVMAAVELVRRCFEGVEVALTLKDDAEEAEEAEAAEDAVPNN